MFKFSILVALSHSPVTVTNKHSGRPSKTIMLPTYSAKISNPKELVFTVAYVVPSAQFIKS